MTTLQVATVRARSVMINEDDDNDAKDGNFPDNHDLGEIFGDLFMVAPAFDHDNVDSIVDIDRTSKVDTTTADCIKQGDHDVQATHLQDMMTRYEMCLPTVIGLVVARSMASMASCIQTTTFVCRLAARSANSDVIMLPRISLLFPQSYLSLTCRYQESP